MLLVALLPCIKLLFLVQTPWSWKIWILRSKNLFYSNDDSRWVACRRQRTVQVPGWNEVNKSRRESSIRKGCVSFGRVKELDEIVSKQVALWGKGCGVPSDALLFGLLAVLQPPCSTRKPWPQTRVITGKSGTGEISGYHNSESDGCLLGCCYVQSGTSLPTFHRYLQPPLSGRSRGSNPEDSRLHKWHVLRLLKKWTIIMIDGWIYRSQCRLFV
jgi:hypothetical protein